MEHRGPPRGGPIYPPPHHVRPMHPHPHPHPHPQQHPYPNNQPHLMAPPPFFTSPPPPGPNMMLPPGWTEHHAPDGTQYYYNASTGTSSWTRPTFAPPPPLPLGMAPPPMMMRQQLVVDQQQQLQQQQHHQTSQPSQRQSTATSSESKLGDGSKKVSKKTKKEKAVQKTQILETPWFIVVTSNDNTFFYNKETKVSLWVPTPELEAELIKMGNTETQKLQQKYDAEQKAMQLKRTAEQQQQQQLQDQEEANRHDDKRVKVSDEAIGDGTEMTEDDVAWQLAMMEDQMGDDDNGYDQNDDEEDDEDDGDVQQRLAMLQGGAGAQQFRVAPATYDTQEEKEMAFLSLMRERGVTAFDTWEKAVERIEDDHRYYIIADRKEKIELFEEFSKTRARELAEEREREQEKLKVLQEKRGSSSVSITATEVKKSGPEATYRQLMEENTTIATTWLNFMTKYRTHPDFLILKPGSLRESIFRTYLSDLKKGKVKSKALSDAVSGAAKSKSSESSSSFSSKDHRKEDVDDFKRLLRTCRKDILYEHKKSRDGKVEWRRIKGLIDRDRRYDGVRDRDERERLFDEYARLVIDGKD